MEGDRPFFGDDLIREIDHVASGIFTVGIQPTTNVTISGAWGAGKSRAAERLISKIKVEYAKKFEDENKLLIFQFGLLPFGNISESVTEILSEVAETLWSREIVNVKSEMRRLIGSTTPELTNVGFTVGPLSISRSINHPFTLKDHRAELESKFNRISRQGYRLVIMLDDLDRLKPEEITIILRMVESLQQFPGMIIILPYYREVVSHAIEEDLRLDASSSHAFLRKFKGRHIALRHPLNVYSQKFQQEFKLAFNRNARNISRTYGMNFEELAWFTLVHHLVLIEVTERVKVDLNGNTLAKYYPNAERSNYLYSLRLSLENESKFFQAGVDIDPFAIEDVQLIKIFSSVYSGLIDNGDANRQLSSLLSLIFEDLLVKPVYELGNERATLKSNSGRVRYDDSNIASLPTQPVFQRILLPLLKETSREPMITDYYTLRDMSQLAKQISEDKDMIIDDNNPTESLKCLIKITKRCIEKFR